MTNVSADINNMQRGIPKPVSKPADATAAQQAAVSNLALKESVTGMKWNDKNEVNSHLTHEDTVFLSSLALNRDKIDASAVKPATRTKDSKMGGFSGFLKNALNMFKEALMALYEGAHNFLASIFAGLKAGAHKELAEKLGATPDQIKEMQKLALTESRERHGAAMKNYVDAEMKQAIFG